MTDGAVSTCIKDRHGVAVAMKFGPVFQAMLQERKMQAEFRRKQEAEKGVAAAA